jgi:hypothetical protein
METAFEEHPHISIGHWCGEKVAIPPFFQALARVLGAMLGAATLLGK